MDYEAEVRSPAEAAVVEERLRRLASHANPHLAPVRSYSVSGTRARVTIDDQPSLSLESVLAQGPLAPPEAAAAVWGVLAGLQALHAMALAHGDLRPPNVQIAPDGNVFLTGHWFQASRKAAADELVADVAAAGGIGCAALGIGVHPAPGAPPAAAELQAPALSRTLRAIASGASGGNVAGARMALSATAASLLEAEALARAQPRLAARADLGAGPVPIPASAAPEAAPAPVLPPPSVQPLGGAPPGPPVAPVARPASTPAPVPPARRYVATAADFEELRQPFDRSRVARIAMALGVLLIVLAVIWVAGSAISRSLTASSRAATTPTARPSTPAATPRPTASAATPTPTPKPSGPNFGPASADPVKSVQMTISGPCTPGAACTADVVVNTSSAGGQTDIAWTIRAYDVCTATMSDLATDHVTEQAGWNHVEGNRGFTVPSARGQVMVAAVTTSPATAASTPITIGQATC